MDRKRLRYFQVVAEEGNVQRASDKLFIAQSALSRHMRALEEELGFDLFERHSTGVRLTNAGVIFEAEAAKLLNSFDTARRRAKAASEGILGVLTIGANEVSVRDPEALRLVDDLRLQFPAVNIDVKLMQSQEQVEKVIRGEMDLGLVFNPPRSDDSIIVRDIRQGSFELLIPRCMGISQQPSVSKSDLKTLPFVVLRHNRRFVSYWDIVYDHLLDAGIMPVIACEAESVLGVVSLVSAGCGVALVHDACRSLVGEREVLRPVNDLALPLTLSAIWRADNPSPLIAQFTQRAGWTAALAS